MNFTILNSNGNGDQVMAELLNTGKEINLTHPNFQACQNGVVGYD